jgi:hypothetical protein
LLHSHRGHLVARFPHFFSFILEDKVEDECYDDKSELNGSVEDKILAEVHPHGDAVQLADVGIRPKRIVPIDVGQRMHVIDWHRAIISQQVSDEEDDLNNLHSFQANHFVQKQGHYELEEGQAGQSVAKIEDNVLERGRVGYS